ncbi:RNA-directed DNA polymerase, eukaryota, reverse transcriptase zinc-binding domain protein [Tanacetum coccineum]
MVVFIIMFRDVGVEILEPGVQDIQSADPFNIYPLLDKKNNLEPKDNKSVPLGFTLLVRSDMDVKHEVGDSIGNMKDGKLHSDVAVTDGISGKQNIRNVKEDSTNSVVSGHFKKSKIPQTGGSTLSMLDEMVKVGQVMGYNTEGCQSNMAEIIRSQGVEEETKMENMNLLCVRMCWGNLDFDYARSDSVGNSGGILCVWDPNSFCKHSVTCSDYFVMVRGVWRSTGQLVLLIAVYAPQEVSEKQMLWDFLQSEISKWHGDVIIMGDFNEVRFKSDRFGSVFNAHAASIFNNFIRSSGLAEINLGGSSFTWCHKSASKMSKLDRFLVSESFLNKCPNVNAITLERFLSDHRPILLRESNVDYGPTPFRFYHHWIEMEGFCKMVEDGWKDSKTKLISDLEVVDTRIDKGYGTVEDIKSRVELLCKIQDIDKLKSIEMAQKIKEYSWSHGQWCLGGKSGESKEGVLCVFQQTFCCPNPRYVRLQMSFPNMLSNEQQRDLECEVSNAEIKKAVWDCNMVKDFRPISLVGSLYKIISKILANRLVGVLSDIVSDVQSAFIAERQILHGPFILNEVLRWCKVKKKQALIFKVDFEKAYDSVRWDFLDEVLSKFGFGDKWRKWIQACLMTSRGSILINGSPTEEFQFGKGLKQGDPLAPFLFILIMESLHLSFQRVVEAGMFQGLHLGGEVILSHMFYADDAVFVGQWSEGNINSLVHVLDCFNLVSGLKINMKKSKIMGMHVKSDKVNTAATKLGCLVLKVPFTYLGSKVGGVMSKFTAWSEVVDRVKNRLSKWKMNTLSIGGRLTLLKSVLGSMPIFHMSLFKVPSGVLNILESIRSHFFNGHDTNSKKASWVKWKSVLAPKERGGLGVSSLYALNRGLLFKWIWRFYSQKSSLWSRVIKAIHGVDGRADMISRAGKRSCWLNIIHEVKILSDRGIDLMKSMSIKLGDGVNTDFWEDCWSVGGKLKHKFPRLYALEECKSISVASKLGQHNLAGSFRRTPRGGVEQHQFDEMTDLVKSISLVPRSDRLRWDLDSSGDFTVASVRKHIDDRWLPRFNISRRGINIDSIMCSVYEKGVETTNHLFFSCCVVKEVCSLIFRWWDVPVGVFDSYDGWLGWINTNMDREAQKGYNASIDL